MTDPWKPGRPAQNHPDAPDLSEALVEALGGPARARTWKRSIVAIYRHAFEGTPLTEMAAQFGVSVSSLRGGVLSALSQLYHQERYSDRLGVHTLNFPTGLKELRAYGKVNRPKVPLPERFTVAAVEQEEGLAPRLAMALERIEELEADNRKLRQRLGALRKALREEDDG